jgi:SAM-dependent methyltransferase
MQPDNRALEASHIVANCRMNRQRGLASYAAELRFDPRQILTASLAKSPDVAWLDLCCGSGAALAEAAEFYLSAGLQRRVVICGIDLVGMFAPQTRDYSNLTLLKDSVHRWKAPHQFDLITCVHGLHYVGDKLGLIARALSWLTPNGLFAAHLDLANLKLVDRGSFAGALGRQFKALDLRYHRRFHLLTCQGQREVQFAYEYQGADDLAGTNFTGQEAVDSYYRRLAPQ